MAEKPVIQIIEANMDLPEHIEAFKSLTQGYMADEMGGGIPWTKNQEIRIIEDLKNYPQKYIFLARTNQEFVGICTCFPGYSTFLATPLINIHDIFVERNFRGLGVGRLLMRAVEKKAVEIHCGKITLEVRRDNARAQGLYQSEGYNDADPPLLFWSKYL